MTTTESTDDFEVVAEAEYDPDTDRPSIVQEPVDTDALIRQQYESVSRRLKAKRALREEIAGEIRDLVAEEKKLGDLVKVLDRNAPDDDETPLETGV